MPDGRWIRQTFIQREGESPRTVKWKNVPLVVGTETTSTWVEDGNTPGMVNKHPPVLGPLGMPLDDAGNPLPGFADLDLSPNSLLALVSNF